MSTAVGSFALVHRKPTPFHLYETPEWLRVFNSCHGFATLKSTLPGSPGSAAAQAPPEEKAKEEPPPEATVGDLVEMFMGRGQVRGIREEDGMLEVWAMGWEMAGEQRPRYFVSRDAVKVVPTVYYKMPGKCVPFFYVCGFFLSRFESCRRTRRAQLRTAVWRERGEG